jgi:hypothetical protein
MLLAYISLEWLAVKRILEINCLLAVNKAVGRAKDQRIEAAT